MQSTYFCVKWHFFITKFHPNKKLVFQRKLLILENFKETPYHTLRTICVHFSQSILTYECTANSGNLVLKMKISITSTMDAMQQLNDIY